MRVDGRNLDVPLIFFGGNLVANLRNLLVTYWSRVSVDEYEDHRLLALKMTEENFRFRNGIQCNGGCRLADLGRIGHGWFR